jgi:hypothetical protein
VGSAAVRRAAPGYVLPAEDPYDDLLGVASVAAGNPAIVFGANGETALTSATP